MIGGSFCWGFWGWKGREGRGEDWTLMDDLGG